MSFCDRTILTFQKWIALHVCLESTVQWAPRLHRLVKQTTTQAVELRAAPHAQQGMPAQTLQQPLAAQLGPTLWGNRQHARRAQLVSQLAFSL